MVSSFENSLKDCLDLGFLIHGIVDICNIIKRIFGDLIELGSLYLRYSLGPEYAQPDELLSLVNTCI